MALLFGLPAWILWDGRTGAAFVAFVVAASTVPDVDIVLMRHGFPVEHHGVAHTIPFVLVYAAVGGIVAVAVLRPTLKRWWRLTEDETIHRGTISLFVTGGLVLGGLSHIFGDTLTRDSYQQVEPFWPLLETEVEFGIAHFSSPWLNGVLFAGAVALHLAVLASGSFPVEHRYRRWRTELQDGQSPE